jgi:hypothetical protein
MQPTTGIKLQFHLLTEFVFWTTYGERMAIFRLPSDADAAKLVVHGDILAGDFDKNCEDIGFAMTSQAFAFAGGRTSICRSAMTPEQEKPLHDALDPLATATHVLNGSSAALMFHERQRRR